MSTHPIKPNLKFILDFQTEECCDIVSVHTGFTSDDCLISGGSLVTELRGPYFGDLPGKIYIYHHEGSIKFETDESVTHLGFHLRVQVIEQLGTAHVVVLRYL